MTLRTALFALTDAAYKAFDTPPVARQFKCIMCEGSGRDSWYGLCPNCDGHGVVVAKALLPKDGTP